MSGSASDPISVEALAEEYLERRRRGERPTMVEYAARYPHLADEILEFFPVLGLVEDFKPGSSDATGSLGGTSSPGHVTPHERLGDYRILREVGRGGMGVVYEAEQESLGRRVALKVLAGPRRLDPMLLVRFHREAKAAGRLHHTNIVPVFGVGEHEGVHYYVMQFIRGLGLDEVLEEVKRLRGVGAEAEADARSTSRGVPTAAGVARSLVSGRFPPTGLPEPSSDSDAYPPPPVTLRDGAESPSVRLPGPSELSAATDSARQYALSVARIGAQVAEALEYAHGQGILHRDVKPSNLLLDPHGTVWVTDFGLAKVAADGDLTHTGDIVGTIRYMAPERFQGKCDARSDVYALGLTLYELLARRPAFDEAERNTLIRQVTQAEPPRMRRLDPTIPRDLETVVHKAIERDPAHRYATAAALADDLQRFLDDRPIAARRVRVGERLVRWGRRNPVVAGLSGLMILTLVGVAVGATVTAIRIAKSRDDLEVALYRNRIALADRELEANSLGRALELLDQCPPRLRDWEHWHLARQCRTDARRVLIGHKKDVSIVEFSSDGRFLASASLDGTVKVWDATSGTLIRTLPHALPVMCVAFSPDGRLLASASGHAQSGGAGAVTLWDSRSWKEVAHFDHTGPVWSVAFSHDGSLVASAGEDMVIRLWDPETRKPVSSLLGHGSIVTSLAFGRDGRLASGSYDTTVRIWDPTTRRVIRVLKGHEDPIFSVAFDPEGRLLASAGYDNKVTIWDTTAGVEDRPHRSFRTNGDCKVAFSPDGRRLAVGGLWGDNTVQLFDPATGQKVLDLRGHPARTTGVAFAPTGRRLAAGSDDGAVILWDADRWIPVPGQEPVTLAGHRGEIFSVAYSPDGRYVATAGWDKTARIWDAATGKEVVPFRGHNRVVFSVAFHPGGKWVASSSLMPARDEMGEVRFWDPTTGEVSPLTIHDPAEMFRVAFSPDGEFLVTAGATSTATIWKFPTGERIRTLPGHSGNIWDVAFSLDGTRLATASRDGTIKLWEFATGRCLHTFVVPSGSSSFSRVAYSRNGLLAVVGGDGAVTIWDDASDKVVHSLRGPTEAFFSVTFSPDGRFLAGAYKDRTVRLWDVSAERELHKFRGHTDLIIDLAFSPDGTRLVSGGWDGTAKIWDVSAWTVPLRAKAP